MLFNSLPFLFVFLPATLVGFFALGKLSHRLAAVWLVVASLVFYGSWNAKFVSLLLGSIAFNYAAGSLIAREVGRARLNRSRLILAGAIAGDLSLLAYFKYANFFADSIGAAFGLSAPHWQIILPLGISFFTFTQIAFLVDNHQRKVNEYDFIRYTLFVTYFPHLIAGPIIHHSQVMPQFAEPKTYRIDSTNLATGLTFLIIGLVKKVLVADQFALIVNPLFSFADAGLHLKTATAWSATMAYALQLYFDFSGYSDMAIGLSLMFNVTLPINFNSPYKANSIIDFWKRWHITLSSFLRDYLYIPLGGNRKSEPRRYLNLMVTMLLGGLWHGAGWTFVLWGGLHGTFLVINHAYNALKSRFSWPSHRFGIIGSVAAQILTFGCVVIAWAIFRSNGIATALSIIKSMLGGCAFSECSALGYFEFYPSIDSRVSIFLFIGAGLIAVWALPNTQEFILGGGSRSETISKWTKRLSWNPKPWWCWVPMGILSAWIVIRIASNPVSQFLYYQF